ncbi:MAG: M14 family metallopeptidase [Gemmatimonadota bacterium]
MRIPAIIVVACGALASNVAGQVTTAERTGYRETSSHADVMAFLDSLGRKTPDIRQWTLGESPEGRTIPVVVAARPMVDNPAAAHRSGKPILMVQANIHAGEVEGKEAAQMLLRDLTTGPLHSLLDSVIVLFIPIYNADGNDHFAPGDKNRPGQNGPAIVGERANGQGLDLNRDYVKQEAPETRAALALINAWDPDFFIDLHTTNGSYHGYLLTYSPGLNPNSPPPNEYVRDQFLPMIRQRMRQRHKQETFSYGNFRNQTPDSLIQGWETYDARPRFGSNLAGMRGRLSILSEAYSNAPFADRVSVTYNFVREVMSLAVEQRSTFRSKMAEAEQYAPDSLTLRSVLGPATEQDVIAEITEPDRDGAGPYARRKRTGVFRTIRMPVYDRFMAARKELLPAGYLIPPQHAHLVRLLLGQGMIVERMNGEWHGSVESFVIDSVTAARGVFEGHRTVNIEGQWSQRDGTARAGWYYVPTRQRLGVLAAYLLEPESEDGFATWNFLDRDLRPRAEYPVLRVRRPIAGGMVQTTSTEEN